MPTTIHCAASYNRPLCRSRLNWASSLSRSKRVATVNIVHQIASIWTCSSSMQPQMEMDHAPISFRRCYRLTLKRDLRSSRCSDTHSSPPPARSDLIEEKCLSLNELRTVYTLSIYLGSLIDDDKKSIRISPYTLKLITHIFD